MSRLPRSAAARLDHFNALFRGDADPWNTADARPERKKRQAVLHALPGWRARGLELGCGAGVGTADLAARFMALDAVDGAPAALARAKVRLRNTPGVTLHHMALPARPPRRGVQAVVAGEVLYYLSARALRRQLALLRPGLSPGAVLVVTAAARRHRDFAQDPRAMVRRLHRALGPPVRVRNGAGWRLFVFRLARKTRYGRSGAC